MSNMDFNEVVQPGHEVLDYVQCQRSDGTIYGSRGGCKQKGAKEVKSNKGGEGGGGNNTKEQLSSDNKAKLKKLGTHALRDVMDQVSKKATMAQSDKAKAVIEEAYKLHSAIEKAEGKTPMTITSIIPGATLKKLGINPDKANTSVKAKPSGPKAKSTRPKEAPLNAATAKTVKDYVKSFGNSKLDAAYKDAKEGYFNFYEQEGDKLIKKGDKETGYLLKSQANARAHLAFLNNIMRGMEIISESEYQKNLDGISPKEYSRKSLAAAKDTETAGRILALINDPKVRNQVTALSNKSKNADPKSKTKAKPKPAVKSKPRYSYEDNRKQYKQFYNMVRNQGLGHGDAAGAAEDAMRAKGFDPGDISNQYRKEVREAF